MRPIPILLVFFASCTFASTASAAEPVRFMLHGNMSHEPPTEEYLRFVEQVKPDILIMGVFDQRLYALTVPGDSKTKAQSPTELHARWKEVSDRLHKKGIRLIGQMEMNVVSDRPADLKDSTGWIGYYDKHWDEKRLGRRPTRTAADLLEEPDLDAHPEKPPEADATAKCGCRVNTKAVRACINKPGWRDTQKRMVSAAIKSGVDGFLTNRNFFGHCACEHCREGFRKWLGEQYSAAELKARFGIDNLAKHPLTCVVGAHRQVDSVPDELVLEKQRFAKHQVKDFFDDVYVRHGRKQRPELFVGQWNHLGCFDELHLDRGHLPTVTRTGFAHGAADERWSLPPKLWGRDESLIWYCNWGTTQNTNLEKRYAGDTVLYGKYVRTLAAGKPYVINKYDFYRPRNMMAEAAALGYATNAIATPWQAEEDRALVLRYFSFLQTNDKLYRPAESYAEVGLVFPRRALHAANASPLEYVEAAGRSLVRQHVLFDILPDDMLAQLKLEPYRAVVVAAAEYLEKAERDALARYVKGGGKLVLLPVTREDREQTGAAGRAARRWPARLEPLGLDGTTIENARTDPEGFFKGLQQATGGADRFSRFDAPWTVEVHAYRQPSAKRLIVHFVNYNHQEKATGKSVTAREAPIAADAVAFRLRLPENFRVAKVRFLSPDEEREAKVEFKQNGGVLEGKTPGFLVYGVCVIEGE